MQEEAANGLAGVSGWKGGDPMRHFMGIDVGTGSARAGLFDGTGVLRGSGVVAIETVRPAPDFAEQRSVEIWAAVAAASACGLGARAGITVHLCGV